LREVLLKKTRMSREARLHVTGGETERRIVLLVEDEPLIMLELQEMLDDLGWNTAHLASDIDKALELAQREVLDLAILDVNVKGRTSFPVAQILAQRNVPIILATGYSTEMILENYPRAVYLPKPYVTSDLAKALEQAMDRAPGDEKRRRA
jgi:CheY-like chemotaxis protein